MREKAQKHVNTEGVVSNTEGAGVGAVMRGRTKQPVGQGNGTSCSAFEPVLCVNFACIQVNTRHVCAACTGVPRSAR